MRISTVALMLGMIGICGCSAPKTEDSILDTLKKAADESAPLYGHQDDLMYGHTWNATVEADTTLERSDVLATSGHYPAILGLDISGVEIGDSLNIDGNDFNLIRAAAIKHHDRGGIVTLSWHVHNPYTGGDSWDISSDKAVASILPGGEKHEYFMGWLSSAADFIESLGFPVIFRPWHEHSGGWFWWGCDTCTPEEYNALWVMTYDYMVNERGFKDMVWAISPGLTEGLVDTMKQRYPGDDYVDIVGIDAYQYVSEGESPKGSSARFVSDLQKGLPGMVSFAQEHGKLFAITETGYEGLYDPEWWTDALAAAMEGFPIAYVLTWRNSSSDIPPYDKDHHFYAPWPGQCSEANFKAWCESGKVTMLD